MSYRVSLAILCALLVGFAVGAQGQNDGKVEKSPHAEALEVVFKTQQARLREVKENGWHDTKERTWVVKRPFGPGIFFSTHWFDVT